MAISWSVTIAMLGVLLIKVYRCPIKNDFKEENYQVDFLWEMYNLVPLIDVLSMELAPSNQGQLHDFHNTTSKVISLTNKEKTKTIGDITFTMHSIPEHS